MHDTTPPPSRARRRWLQALAAAALMGPAAVPARDTPRRLRMLLNTGFSSPQAWLWLALGRGYLAKEGIALDLTPGAGAYTAAPRMVQGAYDLAYGDVNALVELCARRPDAAPRGVYMVFNASPSCVLVAADPTLLRRVRFLRYADFVPDLYGSVVMASQALLRDEPALVRRLLRALNQGVVDMLRDPAAALDSVLQAVPGLQRGPEHARLMATLALEMNAALPPAGATQLLGGVDHARMECSIALMAAGSALPRRPSAHDVFDAAHLPPAQAPVEATKAWREERVATIQLVARPGACRMGRSSVVVPAPTLWRTA